MFARRNAAGEGAKRSELPLTLNVKSIRWRSLPSRASGLVSFLELHAFVFPLEQVLR